MIILNPSFFIFEYSESLQISFHPVFIFNIKFFNFHFGLAHPHEYLNGFSPVWLLYMVDRSKMNLDFYDTSIFWASFYKMNLLAYSSKLDFQQFLTSFWPVSDQFSNQISSEFQSKINKLFSTSFPFGYFLWISESEIIILWKMKNERLSHGGLILLVLIDRKSPTHYE